MPKLDKVYTRKASDLEQKYNFGKSFAEAMGLAEEAKETAESAQQAADDLDKNLTSEEIYNRLTNKGVLQGLFRGKDGNLYFNGAFIYALEKLFAKDIAMTGKFESTGEAYLPPTFDDAIYLLRHTFYPSEYPLPEGYSFDFNGDGIVDLEDALVLDKVLSGAIATKDLPCAVKTPVTIRIDMSNPEKAVCISGNNMFGTLVETYLGADVLNAPFVAKDIMKITIQRDDDGSLYRYGSISDAANDAEKEYFNPPMAFGVEYRTIERWLSKPVYTKIIGASESLGYTIIRKSETVGDYIQVWYIK